MLTFDILKNSSHVIIQQDKFLTFIDMFHKETVKIEVCKSIMEAYCRQKQESIRDPVVINGVMFLCRVLHDSVKYSSQIFLFIGAKRKFISVL